MTLDDWRTVRDIIILVLGLILIGVIGMVLGYAAAGWPGAGVGIVLAMSAFAYYAYRKRRFYHGLARTFIEAFREPISSDADDPDAPSNSGARS